MQHTIITASPIFRLRDPEHERLLAIVHKPTAPTANLVAQRVMSRVLDWHRAGNIIETHDGRILDIERMERAGEQVVYDINGKQIFLEDEAEKAEKKKKKKKIPLIRMDDVWGENSRRTMNRIFEKIEHPSTQQIAERCLSKIFWLDVSKQIMEQVSLLD